MYKEIKLIDWAFNLIDINDFGEEELLEDDIFITKMMLVEKCKDETEIIKTLEKITKIIKTEDKSIFGRIVKEIWVLRIGEENANKILAKIEEGKKKIMEIVQRMIAENFSKNTIMKITGLKEEEIDRLK